MEDSLIMGSAEIQGDLWGARAREWVDFQEGSFRPLYEAAFAAVKLGKGTSVLDVGCGAGLACSIAQSHGAQISGIDAAAALVDIAKQRCPGADIRVGEIEALPFADDSFNVTTGFNAFQYASDPVHALVEARRVTKPTGSVVIAVWGAADKCDLAPCLAAIGKLLPPPPPGAPGPFALSAPGALEALVEKAGLKPEGSVARAITIMRFPDEETAVRGLLASGVAERAMRNSGEDATREGIGKAIRPAHQNDGTYAFRNEFCFLVTRA